MYKKTNLLPLLLFFFYLPMSFAQQETPAKQDKWNWDIALEGMVGVAVGNDFYAFNVGGPAFMLRLNENLRIGVGALPSFYIKEGQTGAKLGVSPRIDYKRFVFIAPFYHFENPNQWVWSVGLGFKFHSRH